MAAFCAERGIALLPYGVLAGGLLSDRYLGAPAERWCGVMWSVGRSKWWVSEWILPVACASAAHLTDKCFRGMYVPACQHGYAELKEK
jgi:aryl-alcohol dehydrogenase-like predicted oxidoreductase